jgi:Ca2+-binding RTX toxin-like protein
LNAALAKVGPALTISLPSGDYATGLAPSDVTDLQSASAASFVGPMPEPGFLEDYTPPLFDSGTTPSALIFNGADNVDNTLNLDLSTLPRNEDGSLQISTIVYNGGAGGFDTAKISGGKFKSEVYVPTGKDSGVVTYTPDDNSGPLTLIYTGLEPFIDTTYSSSYWVSTDSTSSHSINIADGVDQEGDLYDGDGNYLGQGTNHTLRIYDPSAEPAFEEVSLANKQYVTVDAADNNVNFQYTRQPTGIGQLETFMASSARADISTLQPSGDMQLDIHGWDGSGDPTVVATRSTSTAGVVVHGNLEIDDQSATDPYTYDIGNGAVNGFAADWIQSLTINGGSGDNTFNVASGAPDQVALTGGIGNDTFDFGFDQPGLTNITIDGAGGTNTVSVSDGFSNWTSGVSYYSVSDSLIGTPLAGITYAHVANVQLSVNNTTAYVGVSSTAAGAAVTIVGGTGVDHFYSYSSGNKTFIAGTGGGYFGGGTGNDVFVSGSGDDTMVGGPGNNTFVFPAASTAANGQPPALGHDTIIANPSAASNTLDFSQFDETQRVNINIGSTAQQTVTSGVLNLTLQATGGDTGIDNVVGGAGDDTITGNSRYNRLYGEGGNDTLTAGSGGSALWGGDGNDTLTGGSGKDYLYGEDGNDTLTAGSGTEWLDGGNATTHNIITAGSGTDTIVKGHGDETIQDGSGSTTFVFQYVPGDYGLGTATITAYSGTKTGTDHLDFSNFFATDYTAPSMIASGDQTVSADQALDQENNTADLLHLTFSGFTTAVTPDAPGPFIGAVRTVMADALTNPGTLHLSAFGTVGDMDSVAFYLDSNGDGLLETDGTDQLLGTATDATYGYAIDLPYSSSTGCWTAQDGSSTSVALGSSPASIFALPFLSGIANSHTAGIGGPAPRPPAPILPVPPAPTIKWVRAAPGADANIQTGFSLDSATYLGFPGTGPTNRQPLGAQPAQGEVSDWNDAPIIAADPTTGQGISNAFGSVKATASVAPTGTIQVDGKARVRDDSSFLGTMGTTTASSLATINTNAANALEQEWTAQSTDPLVPVPGIAIGTLTLTWNESAIKAPGGGGGTASSGCHGHANFIVYVNGALLLDADLNAGTAGSGATNLLTSKDAWGNVIGNPTPVQASGKVGVPFNFPVVGGTPVVAGTVVDVFYIVDESGNSGAQSRAAPAGTLSSASASGSMEYSLSIT